MAVSLERKPLFIRDIVLGGLDFFGFEFHDLPATGTNKVVVMLTVRLVTRQSIIKVPFICQARIDEKLHRSIDRGISNSGVVLTNDTVELLAREMTILVKENLQDDFPLAGSLELVLLKMFGEDSLLQFMGHNG